MAAPPPPTKTDGRGGFPHNGLRMARRISHVFHDVPTLSPALLARHRRARRSASPHPGGISRSSRTPSTWPATVVASPSQGGGPSAVETVNPARSKPTLDAAAFVQDGRPGSPDRRACLDRRWRSAACVSIRRQDQGASSRRWPAHASPIGRARPQVEQHGGKQLRPVPIPHNA